MPAKELMTWQGGLKRWVKSVPKHLRQSLGKTLVAVSCKQLGTEPTRDASRLAANQWWLNLEASAEPPAPSFWEKRRSEMINWAIESGHSEEAQQIAKLSPEEIKNNFIESLGNKIVNHQLGINDNNSNSVWDERLTKTPPSNSPRSISKNIQDFLNHKKANVSIGRWDNLRGHLKKMEDLIGGNQPIDKLTSPFVLHLYDHIKAMPDLGGEAKRDHYASCKQFITHLAELDLIPLPSKLRSKSLSFPIEDKEIVVFTIPEMQKIYDKAVARTKLFILLALNCAFTQKDISDLKPSEVDLKTGVITRKRSKTSKLKNAPKIAYQLWPTTHKLLKQFASNGERILVTEDGTLLHQDSLNGVKRSKSDNLRSCFVRAMDAAKIPKDERKSFKSFRKTSSTKLAEHPEFGRYYQHFLGHTPKTVADKHYVIPSQERFNAALAWLGEQYTFIK